MPGGGAPSKRPASDQPESSDSSAQLQRQKRTANKREKDFEISVPIVYGTAAFWLGRKATELVSHKWTVYVRGATNEDLGPVVKKVVFQLHSTFNNPTRIIDAPPFEVSESGWGDFVIDITLHFHEDVRAEPLYLYHRLKLYPDHKSAPLSVKKPVVVESYDEIVFPEPSDTFLVRMLNHPAVNVLRLLECYSLPPLVPLEDEEERKRADIKDSPPLQWFNDILIMSMSWRNPSIKQ